MIKRLMAAALLLGCAMPAAAQEAAQEQEEDRPQRRYRIGLGPQLVPSFPGSDDHSIRPLIDFTRVEGDELFPFEAADESAAIPLIGRGRLQIGPSLGFEGERERDDLDVILPRVKSTIELGGFVQFQLTDPIRLRAEVRRGVGGHNGLVANLSADFVARDGDDWLFSVGPRVTLTNGRYQRAYFGVTPEGALTSGLPVYRPGGGLQAVGATVGALRQITERWGVQAYAKYDRLVDDAGRSPIARGPGSRDQLSGGIALTYTFGG